MRSRPFLLSLAFLLSVACSGDGIKGQPTADGPVVRFDVLAPDAGQTDRGPAPDLASKEAGSPHDAVSHDGQPPGDGPGTKSDGGGACSTYSAWTCKVAVGALLCTSTCGSDQLACTNGGTCQCGIGLGPCTGTYGGASPCDVCRAAWLGGCCKL